MLCRAYQLSRPTRKSAPTPRAAVAGRNGQPSSARTQYLQRCSRATILMLVCFGSLAIFTPPTVQSAEPVSARVDFNREIRPLLAKNCFACHGPDANHREGGLRLDVRDVAIAAADSGAVAIAPGQPAQSELLRRITAQDESERMPPPDSAAAFTPRQVDLIRRWIEQDAVYAQHWSFVKPVRSPLPDVRQREWIRNEIDAFVLARLEHVGLAPAATADKHMLIRRLSLDLRGLPPSPEEVAAFVNDTRPEAYERLVDTFLDDPAYGERWARMWLDLARYADSMGYGSDPLRTIWRYRDWVISAFNHNLPYDQFTIEQLAGDLLPEPTLDQRIATAFHRNTMTNTEGGTDDEEFRVEAVRDRVDTTLQVWMGLTMGCAKCHNHKYDPISQREYYQVFAYFNQTADNDQPSESPTIPAPTPSMLAETARIDARVAELKQRLETPTAELDDQQLQWEQSFLPEADWTVLKPAELTSQGGATLTRLDDNSILASGANPDQDFCTVSAATTLVGVTGFRLEVIPDPSLPGQGSGRSDDGSFVLSRFSVTAEDAERSGQSPQGRFIRVEIPGENKLLSLAEVQVFQGETNIASTGEARQSSTAFEGPAELAIDGNTNGQYFEAKSTTHTGTETNPWWEVDLGKPQAIDRITIWNRTDGNLHARLANFRIQLLDADRKMVWQQDIVDAPNPNQTYAVSGVRAVTLTRAAADFSHDAFPVQDAIAPKNETQNGWSVQSRQQQPHMAYFTTARPIDGFQATLLRFELVQRFQEARHTLGRFRLSATTDKNLQYRLAVPADMLQLVDIPRDQRTPEQQAQLARYYRSVAPALQPIREEIADLEKSRPAYPTVPVLEELPADKRRTTHLMVKGNFLSPGDELTPSLPAAFHPLQDDVADNRLAVARWIVDRENPLTARVAVNRFWAQLFGRGIVETEEDFGTQGELPTHPQLLDWLAVEFMELDWDVKALLRKIVLSHTYRQSSQVTAEHLEKDPRNQLLSRGPRFRLEAEMVRDQALALGGLLSRKAYGPSVFPPQPPGMWRAAFNGRDRSWETSEGEDRYRRGLYTFWRRTVPYPSMATFDAPSREVCSVRRIRTNTPLQAFVTLNDPVYVEAAQALARRIVREGGTTTKDRAAFGLSLCLSRPARPEQIEQVLRLHAGELAHYREHPEEAEQLATDPLGPIPDGMDPADLAAWTVVGNVLLNLDGVLMKP